VFIQMRRLPTWQYDLEQNIWFTDLTIREEGTSQDHGLFASETWVHRWCDVWGITGKSVFGPVRSQGSWKYLLGQIWLTHILSWDWQIWHPPN